MTDLTSVCVRHVAMLTKFLVTIHLLCVANGKSIPAPQTASEMTLLDKINKERCVFPPANLQLPDKCSELSLSSQVSYDINNIEFYLCVALLDSTERLCHLTKGNLVFGKRVSNALNDSLQTMMTGGDDTLCKEMNIIDVDAKYEKAKLIYSKMKKHYCTSICIGVEESETAQREPICKSIQFAHQQIHAATELQNELNNQGRSFKEREEIPAEKAEAPKTSEDNPKSPVPDKSPAPAAPQTSQRVNVQSIPDESRTASNTDAASNSKPSEVQSSTGKQSSNPNLLHAKEPANAVEPVPISSGTSASKIEKTKVIDDKQLLPLETDENEKAGGDDTLKTEMESPTLVQKFEEHTEDLKVDAIQNKNDQVDGDDGLPQTEDEGQDGLLKHDQFEGDDEEMLSDNGESNKDGADKPSPVENKVSSIPLPASQQKTPQASMMGNFEESEDSHFFAYFLLLSALCILGYLVYHNKRKIIAMAVEGKKGRNTGRRRPNSATYHKLDSNLEEAMASNLASTNSYVIY